jgi:hypothetical protein
MLLASGNLQDLSGNINWNDYKEWYLQNHSKNTLGYAFNYAKRYADVLANPAAVHKITSLSKGKKRLVMIALANLSKYLGIYEHWRSIVKNNGLKWEKKSALETFIDILNSDVTQYEDWLKSVIPELPRDYGIQLIYNALTGLRPTEGCMSSKLLVELSEQGALEKYLDRGLLMLQHFRFPKLFLRRSKNAYITFVPQRLLELMLQAKATKKYQALKSAVRKRHQGIHIADLRKLYATKLRDNRVPQEVIDILQGRIGQSIFLRFYYKPFLQDIQTKTLEAIEPLEAELLSILK